MSMDEYGEVTLLPIPPGTPIDTTAPSGSVEKAFSAFTAASTFEVAVDGHFKKPRQHRYLHNTVIGGNTPDNHFQGLAAAGDHLLLTGSDWTEGRAHLLVIRLNRDPAGLPRSGKLVRVLAIDRDRPHPGGCQRLGDLLVVPLEGKKVDSRVVLLSVADPAKPAFVGGSSTIERPGQPKAGAAGITRLPDGHLLVAVWRDESRLLGFRKTSVLEFYRSRTPEVRDGFHSAPAVLDFGREMRRHPAYQTIALLAPDRDGDGFRVRMVGLRNTQQAIGNYFKGQDVADLFEVRLPASAPPEWGSGVQVRIARLGERTFQFGGLNGNFSAAGGVDLLPGDRLEVHACHHWRTDHAIQFSHARTA
jgi:hypothetical protein